MPVPQSQPIREPIPEAQALGRFLAVAPRPLEYLLASGGDTRLTLNSRDQRNSYGCTPFPRSEILDFASSTASSISSRAFDQAMAAHTQLLLEAILNPNAFDGRVEASRDALRELLGLTEAEVVFSPSGTDAQLQALFLVRAILGTPLATIIVGADQTGSGTAHTSRGHHFSDRTALGVDVQKGAPIVGLSEDVRSAGVPFCDATGHLRSDHEMDAAVYAAVADAISRGEKVLLQAMDSSKLGWSGPSAACLEDIAAAWPDKVVVVMDACQMRLGLPQLRDYLAREHLVLITGSKFFTGPAFSGALLVPAGLSEAASHITAAPQDLKDYTTRYDWPSRWRRLRETLPNVPNHGQWLRWEATLAEMNAYFAVPDAFRHSLLKECDAQVSMLLVASGNLSLLSEHCGAVDQQLSEEMVHRTIFSFVPCRRGKPLPLPGVTALYRAMGRNLSSRLPSDASDIDRSIAARICQIGQPVALGHRPGAILRISMSARLVSGCWDTSPVVAEALEPILENVQAVIQKLEWLIDRPELLQSEAE
jgi:hypothetical protein